MGGAILVTVVIFQASFVLRISKDADSCNNEACGLRRSRSCRHFGAFVCSASLLSADSYEDEARGGRHPRNCMQLSLLLNLCLVFTPRTS